MDLFDLCNTLVAMVTALDTISLKYKYKLTQVNKQYRSFSDWYISLGQYVALHGKFSISKDGHLEE